MADQEPHRSPDEAVYVEDIARAVDYIERAFDAYAVTTGFLSLSPTEQQRAEFVAFVANTIGLDLNAKQLTDDGLNTANWWVLKRAYERLAE